MNYLAHAYLSFQNPEILVGNMISDFVKGKNKFTYSPQVQNGIMLHRAIDTFTDSHNEIKNAKQVFQPTYRLYSGAFIDVVMDHFLAKKINENNNLMAFTQLCYKQLGQYTTVFPLYFQNAFPNMQQNNWLYNYQYTLGIQKSFIGLQKRATYITEVETAFKIFTNNYNNLQESFSVFWNDMLPFAMQTYKTLTNSLPTAYI